MLRPYHQVYEYKGCSTCRKALKWLDAQGIEYKAVPVQETPPNKTELRRVLKASETISVNSSTLRGDYKKLNLDNLDASEAQAIDILNTNGNLVKRPFVVNKSGGLTGFNEDAAGHFGLALRPCSYPPGMNRDEIEAANQRVIEAGAFVQPLLSEAGKVIVGQSYLWNGW